jgi:flagellar motility protein MotE (MotC chaperone)
MMGFVRDLRLIPVAVVASACLLLLTAADLLIGGSDRATSEEPVEATVIRAARGSAQLGGAKSGEAQSSWAQMMFNFPSAKGSPPEQRDIALLPRIPSSSADKNSVDRNNGDIITGSVPDAPRDEKRDKPKGEGAAAALAKEPEDPLPAPSGGTVIQINTSTNAQAPSAAERAILERLKDRRIELEKRARELDIREGLVAEAEKRIDTKLVEVKEVESRLTVAAQKKDEAEASRLKGLVTMYENMKPRDAAKIFDRLDTDVLLRVASLINPRNMSEILAQMSPDRAEQLTVELATRAQGGSKDAHGELPKIEGHPISR